MAKPATKGGKILVYGSKVQFDCGCCCTAPEYRNLAPPTGDFVYLYPGQSSVFSILCDLRYFTVACLEVSEVGPTGPWTQKSCVTAYADPATWELRAMNVSPPYTAPTTIWWRIRMENDCPYTTYTPVRIYYFLLRDDPQRVDCNSCSPQLKKDYVVVWSGLTGAMSDTFGNGIPYTLTNTLSTPSQLQNCVWQYNVDGTKKIILSYFGGGGTAPIWELRLNIRTLPAYCYVSLRKDNTTGESPPVSACTVPISWTWAGDDSYVTPSIGATCRPVSVLTNVAATIT